MISEISSRVTRIVDIITSRLFSRSFGRRELVKIASSTETRGTFALERAPITRQG